MVQRCSQPPWLEAHSSTSGGKPGLLRPVLWGRGLGRVLSHCSAHWTEATSHACRCPHCSHLPIPRVRATVDPCLQEAGLGQQGGPSPENSQVREGGAGQHSSAGSPHPEAERPLRAFLAPLTLTPTAVRAEPVAGVATTLVPARGVGADLPAARRIRTVVQVCRGTAGQMAPGTHRQHSASPRPPGHTDPTTTTAPAPWSCGDTDTCAHTHTGHMPQGCPTCCRAGGRVSL